MTSKIAVALTLLAGGITAAAQTPPMTPEQHLAADVAAQRLVYPRMPDTPGTGPYPAEKLVDPDFPDHVVYRPIDLAALGSRKLKLLVWGNGGCAADGAGARLHLAEIASHGFLVVAPGRILSGPGAPPAPPPPAGSPAVRIEAPRTTSDDVRRGIDLALAANAKAGSPYFGRVDAARIAVSGHSCGGLQALQVAADPRIKAVVIHDSGFFPAGQNPIPSFVTDKSELKRLHTPVLYLLGGPTDVAYPNGMDDFARIEQVPVMVANLPVGHLATFAKPNGGEMAQVALDWLDWQLDGDRTAAHRFVGKDCGLCTDPRWTVAKKRVD